MFELRLVSITGSIPPVLMRTGLGVRQVDVMVFFTRASSNYHTDLNKKKIKMSFKKIIISPPKQNE